MNTVLEVRNVKKSFHGVAALKGVSLEFQAGKIHAIIGENGAGKSTLINIITGVLQPDEGEIVYLDKPTRFKGPLAASREGIVVVHQEAELFGHLSLAENMLLGQGLRAKPALPFLIDWQRVFNEANSYLGKLSVHVDVKSDASSVSIGNRVQAALATAIAQEPRVLLLDEPTSSLTHSETDRLLRTMQDLAAKGVAVIFVSHRLDEILAIADTVSTLRDGTHVSTTEVSGLNRNDLIKRMVGREIDTTARRSATQSDDVILSVKELSSPSNKFKDVSFEVRKGEILGVYGLVGAGRTEVARAIMGLDDRHGRVTVGGHEVPKSNLSSAIKMGLAYVPEDRLNEGIFGSQSCEKNVSVASLPRLTTLGLLDSKKEAGLALKVVSDFSVKVSNIKQPIHSLSGGNQQKLVLGRWVETEPKVLILDEPTRGVDVGAKDQIHSLIEEYASGGKGVVLISSDMSEVLRLSDRVLVLRDCKVADILSRDRLNEESIVELALPVEAKGERELGQQKRPIRELGLLTALIFLFVAMSLFQGRQFLDVGNLLNTLTSASIVSIGSLGISLVIMSGGIDISVGRMLGFVGACSGLLAIRGVHPALCLSAGVGLGALLGSLNSLVCAVGRIHPIVVTLATMSLFQGAMLAVTGGREVHPLPFEHRALADGTFLGIPKLVLWSGGVLAFGIYLIHFSLLGRRILALGNSEKASKMIGLVPWKLRLASFAMMGGLIGLSSVLWGGYYGKIQGNTGAGFELQVIAAAVIGGCSIMGGRGSALGSFLGALMIALIRNSLVLLKVNSYWQDFMIGSLILAAVVIDAWLPTFLANRRRE